MTTYSFEIDDETWMAFKIIALKKGMTVKDAIIQAIEDFIEKGKEDTDDLKIEIIKAEKQRNLKALIDETELSKIIKQLIERKQRPRRGYDAFAVDLKYRLFKMLRSGVTITEDIAEELKQFLKLYQDELPEKLVKGIMEIIEVKT